VPISRRRAGTLLIAVVLGAGLPLIFVPPAAADLVTDVQAAAQVATDQGYRTGVATLNLRTGEYLGAGADTAPFASESVAKVLIATELLATGQMTGGTEATAYQMITQSDDDADALYGLAGGDDVINLVAARYDIPFLGTPPELSGWWGNTEITAKGMVYLYAAIARDPTVGPWLMNAMAHATEYGADGTYQYFGIPSATTAAAIKQGWGDDGDDSPDAVFNSTGYVDDDHYAVAILTDGSPSTYGSVISSVVTAQARALLPSGQIDDPAAHDPVLSSVTITASGSTVHLTGTAVDPDSPSAALPVRISEGDATLATAATEPATHRFDVDLVAPDGPHSYTVTVGNVGEGNATSQVAPPVDVNGDPRGAVVAVTGGVGTITIDGQESDPNGQPELAISLDGGAPIVRSVNAPDYDITLPAGAGTHQVTITYLHSAGGQDVTEGSWAVTVTGPRATRDTRIMVSAVTASPTLLLGLVVGYQRLRRTRRRLSAQRDLGHAGAPPP
jgi:hypothetical protein